MKKLFAVLLLGLGLTWAVQAADSTQTIPLTKVVLFYSGVGYFEHQGQVEGDAQVPLTFRVEQINDILKSLVVQDLSGQTIDSVTYAPQDPLAHQLSAFSVSLGDNPSLADLLLRLRGSRVAVVNGAVTYEGVILGTEKQPQAAGETTYEVDVLNLMTDKGMVSLVLPGVTSIKLTDPKLDAEMHSILTAIASSRDATKREVDVRFSGAGRRQARISYLLETPVWKTTYRLVNQDGKVFLQGWALVDNTTDSDWNNVQMALVSGRPISFIEDLYPPVYATRPEVPVSLPGIIAPQTHEGAMQAEGEAEIGAAPHKAERARDMVGAPAPPMAAMAPAAPGMAYGGFGSGGQAASNLALVGTGVTAAASGGQVGELFQYAIAKPVTIPRQQSAMIPIVNQGIDGEKLSLYNERTEAVHPFNAMRLKNNTGLHLMGGPITVYDGGVYAGDALIDDVNKGEERLITYALDLGVEVKVDRPSVPQELVSVKIENGLLEASSRERYQVVYTIKNRTDEARTVLVEHPIMADWKLIAPVKADETTRDLYRFRVQVPAQGLVPLTITMERPLSETVALLNWERPDRIEFFLSSTVISPQVKAALQEIAKRRAEIAQVARDRQDSEARLKGISDEQSRIRQNMAQLDRTSDLYKKYVTKLTQQEDEFDATTAKIAELKIKENQLTDALNAYIRGLNLS